MIFLSYARNDDEPFVERLRDDLSSRDIDVWWDRRSMSSRGRHFQQEIEDAIGRCDRLVLVVGPAAADSDYVRHEWRHAWDREKVVNPILRLGNAALVPFELRSLHWEDFRDDERYDFHLENLVRQLSEPVLPLAALYGVPARPPHHRPREGVLDLLRGHLLEGFESPLAGAGDKVGLFGMGGIGKSTLAADIGRDRAIRTTFRDGVFWVRVGRTDVDDPMSSRLREQVRLHRLLGGDGLFGIVDEGRAALSELLADRRVLLVLDDAADRADVDAFDVLGATGRMLITTRDAGLLSSQGAVAEAAELLTETEALELLAETAGTKPPDELGQAVVEECGCLPLAIVLGGGMVRDGTPWSDVLDALRGRELEFLGDENREEPAHRTLYRVLETSYEALPGPQRERFATLAVFSPVERTPEDVVVDVWSQTSPLSDREGRQLLLKLSLRSLIQLTPTGDPDRVGDLSMHALVHDFAVRVAERRDGGLAALHGRVVDALAAECPDGWSSCTENGYVATHVAVHMTGAERWDDLLDLLASPEFAQYRRWVDGDDGSAGLGCLPRLVDHLRTCGQHDVAAAAATQLGRILAVRGRYDSARERFDEALSLAGWFGGRRARAIAHHEIGTLHLFEGDHPEAEARYRDALRLARFGWPGRPWWLRLLDPRGRLAVFRDEVAANLIGLATCALEQFDLAGAQRLAARAVRVACRAGDHRHEADARRILAMVEKWNGRFPESHAAFRQACDLYETAGMRVAEVRTQVHRGWLAFDEATLENVPPDEAAEFFGSTHEVVQRLGDQYTLLEAKLGLGWCALVARNPEDAIHWFDDLNRILAPTTHPGLHLGGRLGLAALAHQRAAASGDWDEFVGVEQNYREVVADCRSKSNPTWGSRALAGLGAILWHTTRPEAASECWREAEEWLGGVADFQRKVIRSSIEACRDDPVAVPR